MNAAAMPTPHRRRPALIAWLATLALATLLGCAAPLPPLAWVRLPLEVDAAGTGGAASGAGTAGAAGTASAAGAVNVAGLVWQLMLPVPLPGHLDRETLLVPQGSAGLQALGNLRWAEPLRDAVPRLLRLDLSRALAAPVWHTPLPPGVQPTRQLRVELLALDVLPGARAVKLHARYSVADSQGRQPPRAGEVVLEVPAAGADADALLAAHRLALQLLARRIAAQALGGG